MMSSATPTTIRIEVPPRPRAVACEKPPKRMKMFGRTAITPRNRAPGKVSRVSTRSRYMAVGRPGRTPGSARAGVRARRPAGRRARYEAAVLPQVVRLVDRVEGDGGVEEREGDHE